MTSDQSSVISHRSSVQAPPVCWGAFVLGGPKRTTQVAVGAPSLRMVNPMVAKRKEGTDKQRRQAPFSSPARLLEDRRVLSGFSNTAYNCQVSVWADVNVGDVIL